MKYAEFPDSTAVAWATYDGRRRRVRAAYREKMRVYEYQRVPPEEFQNFLNADSKGTYINRFIKPVYEFEEVTEEKSGGAKSRRKSNGSRSRRP